MLTEFCVDSLKIKYVTNKIIGSHYYLSEYFLKSLFSPLQGLGFYYQYLAHLYQVHILFCQKTHNFFAVQV